MKPEEIRAIRKRAGLTQEAFARALEVSLRAVLYWEGGQKTPSRLAIRRILEFKSTI